MVLLTRTRVECKVELVIQFLPQLRRCPDIRHLLTILVLVIQVAFAFSGVHYFNREVIFSFLYPFSRARCSTDEVVECEGEGDTCESEELLLFAVSH